MFSRQYNRPVAVFTMILCTLLWSVAGVLTRHLEAARSFEVTFWRSAFCAIAVVLMLQASKGYDALQSLRRPSKSLLISGALWGVMFCCFMIALTLTSTSNTLIVSCTSPLLTALLARIVLRTPISRATWAAIAIAVGGMVWIFSGGVAAGNPRDVLGMCIALSVPLASAVNIITFKHSGHSVDLVPAVCVGAVFSALAMLPLAWPLQASTHDLIILAILGALQLALPCMLMVVASRSLNAPQISLLGLLEAVFGPLWAWLGAGEVPSAETLEGGAIVVGALIFNEVRQLYRAS